MKKESSTKKKLVLAATLASLVGTVALNSKVTFAGEDSSSSKKMEKKGTAKCADGSCGDKKDKKKGAAKCADGSCGDKKGKKKGHAKCADGSCGNKKDE